MNCKEFSNLLEDYLDDMLSGEEASRVQAHAEMCAECAALLALRRDCRKMDESILVPEEFSSGWRRMIREETKMEKNMQKKRVWQNWLAAAAAVVFVLGGTLLTRDHFQKKETENGYAAYGAVTYDTNASYNTQASLKRSTPATANYSMTDTVAYATEEAADGVNEKIIRTASFTLKTLEYDQDLEKIQAAAAELGGRVEYLSVNGENGAALRTAYLTLRIPSEKLDDFIAGAQEIGKLTALTQESQDVSENYYDTQARLNTQLQKMERLQSLLAAAENITDLIEIESAIADAQYWIDHYTGQLNHYDDQVDYSTVSVSLQEIRIVEAEEATLWQRIISGLQDSLEGGTAFLGDIVVFLIAAAPWLLAVGVVFFVVKIARKSFRRK